MTLYRYVDVVYSTVSISPSRYESYGITAPKVELYQYEVLKETPCGWWIKDDRNLFSDKRWISKTGHFAHSTLQAAKTSFLARKQAQIGIYQRRLYRAQLAHEVGKKL